MREEVEEIYNKMVMADIERKKIEKKLPYIKTQKGREFETKRLEERLSKLEFQEKELFQEFLKQNPTNDELCEVVKWIDTTEVRTAAAKMLLKRNPSNDQLCTIIKRVLRLSTEAGQILLGQDPSNDQLCKIIERDGSLREEAAKMLLEKNPSDDDLRWIIKYPSSISREAGEILLERVTKRLPEDINRVADLLLIMENIPSLTKKVVEIYLSQERDLVDLIMFKLAIPYEASKENPEILERIEKAIRQTKTH